MRRIAATSRKVICLLFKSHLCDDANMQAQRSLSWSFHLLAPSLELLLLYNLLRQQQCGHPTCSTAVAALLPQQHSLQCRDRKQQKRALLLPVGPRL